jgi:hemerythrin
MPEDAQSPFTGDGGRGPDLLCKSAASPLYSVGFMLDNNQESVMNDNILIEWDGKYSVGIQVIDEQHKEFIHLTNALYQGCLEGNVAARSYFMETVRKTIDYAKYHFSAEERMMEKIKFPNFAEHKREHESFIKKILADVESFQEGKKFVPNVFVRYLKDWVLTHVAVQDKKYADYIFVLKKKGILAARISGG